MKYLIFFGITAFMVGLVILVTNSGCNCKESYQAFSNRLRSLYVDNEKQNLQNEKIEIGKRIADSEIFDELYDSNDPNNISSAGEIDFVPHISYFGSNGSRGKSLPVNYEDCEDTFNYCGMMSKQNEYALSRCETSRNICKKLVRLRK